MPADLTGVNWDDCVLERITEMVSRRIHVDRQTGTMFAQTHLRRGALVPGHTHAGAQRIQVVAGAVRVTTGEGMARLEAGERVTIAAGTRHELEALDDSIVVDARDGDVEFAQ
jgi:quercetin dioxygenase-like cupin family protein